MNLTLVFLLAFLIGCICGLRSMTGPAVVCWGAHLGWLRLSGSKLAFLGVAASVAVFTLLALGELIADKLPKIPGRTQAGPLIARFVFGAMCGAAIAVSAQTGAGVGAVLGGAGGIAGAFLGYHVRRWLTVERKLPDFAVALLEDIVAVGGGLLIVSRF